MRARATMLMAVVAVVAACGGSGDESSETRAAPADPTATDGATDDTTGTTDPATTEPAADDDPGDTDSDEDDSSDDAGDDDSAGDPPASGGGGFGDVPGVVPAGDSSVGVDGSALEPQGLLRCIPFSELPEDLDLQVLGDGFILFVYVSTGLPVSQELTIQGRAVGEGETTGVFAASAFQSADGSWSDEEFEPLAAAPFAYSGDRVSGSMVLADVRGSGETVEVSFDVGVPSDVQDCSL